ncbi:hypothetical protein SE17_43985, partial [Kouleothrix aurantiaca]
MRARMFPAFGGFLLLAAMLLAACGQGGATEQPTATGAQQPTAAGPQQPTSAADALPTADMSSVPTAASEPAGNAPADTLRWPVEGLSDLTTLDPAKRGDAPNNT